MSNTPNYLNYYLNGGTLSQVTPEILELTSGINTTGTDLLRDLGRLVHNKVIKGQLPNVSRLDRTAQEILFPTDQTSMKDGQPMIKSCSEYGRVYRAFCLSKNIPAMYVETLENDWIELNRKEYIEDPTIYSTHVWIDVYLDNTWYSVNPVANPDNATGDFLREKTGNFTYQMDNVQYTVICTGLDSREMFTATGERVCFKQSEDFHRFVEKLYPDRFKKLTSE